MPFDDDDLSWYVCERDPAFIESMCGAASRFPAATRSALKISAQVGDGVRRQAGSPDNQWPACSQQRLDIYGGYFRMPDIRPILEYPTRNRLIN